MFKRISLLCLCVTCCALGQDGWRSPFWFSEMPTGADAAIAATRAEAAASTYQQQQFVQRVNRVAALWSKMTDEYNQKRAINIKIAREISEAFHKLEKSEDWPHAGTSPQLRK